MNSGELTRIQLANRNFCASQQISVGPTGPTGAGTPGTASNTGATGPAGAPGAAGAPGTPGSAVNTGATGPDGPTGPTGPIGIDGIATNTGATGQTGSTGRTGSTGSTGPTGPGNTYAIKTFTIFVDYSAAAALSRVYIPPGLFANAPLSAGGTFSTNQGTDLIFLGNPTIAMRNTRYPFIVNLSANGYVTSAQWQLVSPSQIRPGNGYLNITITADYAATIGTDLGAINGANLSVYPSTGTAAGFLGMITLYYI